MNIDILWQLLRYGLIAGGGFLVGKGYVTDSQLQAVVGAIGTIFPIAWGIYVKYGTQAVPDSVANKPSIPTVSGATGQIIK